MTIEISLTRYEESTFHKGGLRLKLMLKVLVYLSKLGFLTTSEHSGLCS